MTEAYVKTKPTLRSNFDGRGEVISAKRVADANTAEIAYGNGDVYIYSIANGTETLKIKGAIEDTNNLLIEKQPILSK
jgi:hypothetical protein